MSFIALQHTWTDRFFNWLIRWRLHRECCFSFRAFWCRRWWCSDSCVSTRGKTQLPLWSCSPRPHISSSSPGDYSRVLYLIDGLRILIQLSISWGDIRAFHWGSSKIICCFPLTEASRKLDLSSLWSTAWFRATSCVSSPSTWSSSWGSRKVILTITDSSRW